MELKDKVTQLKGVGPKKAQALEKLNIRTLEDNLWNALKRFISRAP